jgi:FkbM family methyltransferase
MYYNLIEKISQKLDFWLGIGFGSSSIKKELSSIKKFIPNGKIFIDVGGNKGLYAMEILNLFNPSEVHVFEPSNLNVNILKHKFLGNSKVIINPFGLSNKASESILYADEKGSGLASLSKRNLDHFGISFSSEENIKLLRFDDYWRLNNKIIDLLKIDVEGHELAVLDGIGEFIQKIRVVQFEFGGCNIDTRTYFKDFWYFFEKNNFKIFRITPYSAFEISCYKETYERFTTTNFICLNKDLIGF